MVDAFPSCGCDACDETPSRETERLHGMIDEVVQGHFRQEINIPWLGRASLVFEVGAATGRNGFGRRESYLDRARARSLVREGARSQQFAPWPVRQSP
jgi:hypothetical protein